MISKYLARYAEPEVRVLGGLAAHGPWDQVLVVPVRREGVECLTAGAAPARAAAARCLTILVVNASDADDRRSGEALLDGIAAVDPSPGWASGPGPSSGSSPALALHRVAGLDLLVVDRCRGERGFSAQDGVGLARKLGADLALALHHQEAVGAPWIHTTDADARLPPCHFNRVVDRVVDRVGEAAPEPRGARGAAACVAPFWHVPDPRPGQGSVSAATARYELSLRYYVASLAHAGSAWAFHTIGSLISVSCWAYAAARGFPRRRGGEDFYLLNKVGKLGRIRRLGGPPVEIQSRRSTRVPFGTGPAVEGLLGGKAFEVYDPRVFEVLTRALAATEELRTGRGPAALEGLAAANPDLDELGIWAAAGRVLHERYAPAQLGARVHERIDAFRTLKLVHELTAKRWPKLDWAAALRGAPGLGVDPEAPVDVQRRQLEAAEVAEVDPSPD